VGLSIAGSLGTVAPAYGAENANELAAEASFVEGVALMKEARYTEALERFRQSERLGAASGTLLDIGYCERELGRTASAWFAYRRALALASASGKPEHERMARESLAELEPKLARVSFRRSSRGADWKLELDQSPLEQFSDGTRLPIDPGAHVLRGSFAAKSFELRFVVAPGEQKTVNVPELERQASGPAPKTEPPVVIGGVRQPREAPRAYESQGGTPWRTVAWVVGGAGAAATLTGVGLFVHARLKFDGADCSDDGCAKGSDLKASDSARTEAHVSYVVAGAGLALLGAGVTLWLTNRPPSEESAGVVVGGEAGALRLSYRSQF